MIVRQAHQPLRDLIILSVSLGLIPVARLTDPEHRAGQSNRYAALRDRSFGYVAASWKKFYFSSHWFFRGGLPPDCGFIASDSRGTMLLTVGSAGPFCRVQYRFMERVETEVGPLSLKEKGYKPVSGMRPCVRFVQKTACGSVLLVEYTRCLLIKNQRVRHHKTSQRLARQHPPGDS